jgi:hypothetical protein
MFIIALRVIFVKKFPDTFRQKNGELGISNHLTSPSATKRGCAVIDARRSPVKYP